MAKHVKSPMCIKCGRGKIWNRASSGGNEPFYLIPSEVVKNGDYMGISWNIFCGSCLEKMLGTTKYDLMNIIPKGVSIQIIITGKGRNKQTTLGYVT